MESKRPFRRRPIYFYRRIFRHDVWNIGIVDAPIHTFLTPGARPPVRWLPEPPRGSFLADPFVVETKDGPVIVAEHFSYDEGKGHIAALASTPDGGFGPPRPIIEETMHMSYPAIVQHEGHIYCIPETGATHALHCYEATAFPYHWERRATLIEDFAVLDATIFAHEGRWWLFCSEDDGSPGMTLHLWHAADPLGPWTPHAANPVKRDLRSSRPAGMPFVHDGCLYRPAQDSTRTYGGAVVINKVLRLTPTEFAEEPMTTVAPYTDGPYRFGIHTLSAWGERTVIDGKRHRFIPREFRRVLEKAGGQ